MTVIFKSSWILLFILFALDPVQAQSMRQEAARTGIRPGSGTYYVDASEPDQGAPSSGGGYTIHDIAQAVGPDGYARVVLRHHGSGTNTLYSFDTSLDLSGQAYLFFEIQPGAMLSRITGDEVLTVHSPANFMVHYQQITTDPMFRFHTGGTVFAEWFGIDGTADHIQLQYALDMVRDHDCMLSLMPGRVYSMAGVITLLLTSENDSARWIIEGNGSTLDFSTLSTGNLFTVGAAADSYFAEEGGTVIRNLKILGPETVAPRWAESPQTDCTGLLLQYASGVSLDSIFILRCHTGIKSGFVFPLDAADITLRSNFVGLHLDDASNMHNWQTVRAPECWYGVLVNKSGEFNASAKIDNVSFNKLWVEDCRVGIHLDPGIGGPQPFIRRIYFDGVYGKGITYDVFRLGIAYSFAEPQNRGVDRSANVVGVEIRRSSWGGPFDSDSGALVFSSNSSVREFVGYVSVADSAEAIVNNPKASDIVFLDDESTGAAGFKIKHYDGADSISRHVLNDGTIFNGLRTSPAEHGTTGTEMSKEGYLSSHRVDDCAAYFSRETPGNIARFGSGASPIGYIGGDAVGNMYFKSHAHGNSVDLVSYNSPDFKSVRWNAGVDAFFPLSDNETDLGRASLRWDTVYAGTGMINTSDRNEKQQIEDLSAAERSVARAIRGLIKKYRFNDDVAAEGDDAKIHVGIIAQDVIAAFRSEGLDPFRYGIITRDEWWTDAEGNVHDDGEAAPGLIRHTRLGVRYNELLAFIIAAI